MSSQMIEILSKVIFGGSILVILYVVYYEWKTSQIIAEKNEIALGEKENEDAVNSLDDTALVDVVNKEFSSSPPTNSVIKPK